MIETLSTVCGYLVERGLLPPAFVHPFMARALIAVVVVGGLFGLLSPLVQARRLAFFSAALAQSAMVGVAVGVFLGEPIEAPWAGLFGVTILAALWLVFARRRLRLPADTLVGVFLALSLAAGVTALVLVTRRFNIHQVEAVLFGSPLTVTDGDLGVLLVVTGLVVVAVAGTTRTLLLDALDPGLAAAAGGRTALLEYVFVAVLACAVVVALRVVGALLVEALVVVPAATARLVSSSWRTVTALSVVLGVVGGVVGLIVSAASLVPAGAAIVLVLGAAFVAAALWASVRGGPR
jgi:zinc transport system permease protein